MENLWDNIRRTVLAGTERYPVEQRIREALDIPGDTDDGWAALRALASGKLLQQAAAMPPDAPGQFPEPCPSDPRPLCPPAALKSLHVLLTGGFEPVFSEFFERLQLNGQRLPPERVPQVLDFLARKKGVSDVVASSLGPLGPWLSQFNPAWTGLFPGKPGDWQTGTFAERIYWLKTLRKKEPAKGLARLASSWAQERAEHRLAFLETLSTGLFEGDESFLEQALHDRSLPVRRQACRLLLLLPESVLRKSVKQWLSENRQALKRINRLEKILPEAEVLEPLLAIQPKASPLSAFLEFVPPGDLAEYAGKDPRALLAELLTAPDSDPHLAEVFLANIAVRGEPEWTCAAIELLASHPEHSLWLSDQLAAVFHALPAADWQRHISVLAGQTALLEEESSAIARSLRAEAHAWPLTLVMAVLNYPRTSGNGRNARIPEHFRVLLQQAACRCRPEEISEHNIPEQDWPFAWQSELAQFRRMVQFRRRLHECL